MRKLTYCLLLAFSVNGADSKTENDPSRPSKKDNLQKELFVESYLSSAQKHPDALVSQLAFIVAATGPDVEANRQNQFAEIIKSKTFDDSLAQFSRLLPQVGIGINIGLSAGLISGGFQLNADLKPLVVDVIRSIAGLEPSDVVRRNIEEIGRLDPDYVRALGALVFDSYQNTGALSSLHSLYSIALQADPKLPPPNSLPSSYLANTTPLVRAMIDAKLGQLPSDQRNDALNDWDKFNTILAPKASIDAKNKTQNPN